MSSLVFLVRHAPHAEVGHVLSGRRPGLSLSGEGRAQARRLADKLADKGVSAIHSCPRERARETADLIAARLGLPVETVDALDEIDFGAWTGRSFADLEGDPHWRRWNVERDVASTPGGESMAGATARVVAHLDGLAAAGRSHVLCVSHADVIRGAVAHYLGLGLDRMLHFDIDPASVSTVLIAAWGARIIRLNEEHA